MSTVPVWTTLIGPYGGHQKVMKFVEVCRNKGRSLSQSCVLPRMELMWRQHARTLLYVCSSGSMTWSFMPRGSQLTSRRRRLLLWRCFTEYDVFGTFRKWKTSNHPSMSRLYNLQGNLKELWTLVHIQLNGIKTILTLLILSYSILSHIITNLTRYKLSLIEL